ncbi:MAG: lactonase family protein [Planctomycetaceae bacterium]|nr:lactonase family protein [Planctomycetaceae bacterium]MCB9936956.1 lactonase family protein [Planctomycetaceae bacterium]HRX78611.1 lactonase family protein [Pirellulaceae bacterium]
MPHASSSLHSLLIVCLFLTAVIGATASTTAADGVQDYLAYVGTYTRGGKSKGIYTLKLNMKTGALTEVGATEGVVNPSFVAIHPSNKFLYAVGEISEFDGKPTGGVTAFAINPKDGSLTKLNEKSSGGAGPCHLVVDATGKNVLVANYGGGSVACLPINADGTLQDASSFMQHEGSSIDEQRQKGPHGHSINLSPDNKFAFAADLGLDKVLIYAFDAEKGKLTPHDPAAAEIEPGSGPRHFAFHPSGKYAYVINEMALTVTAFKYNAKQGRLKTLQTISTIPDADRDQPGLSTAEIRVHPSGKFLYGSNRGHDTIVAYRVNQDTGELAYIENESTQGKTPRNFFIDPTGTYLLAENQGSDSIVVFRINQDTGELEPTGNSITIPAPVCIRMMLAP